MVKFPETVSIDTEVIDGKPVLKQWLADGSYRIDGPHTDSHGRALSTEIHYQDGSVRTFNLRESTEDSEVQGEYQLYEEKLADKTHRIYKGDLLRYEKLPNGEERTWDIFFNKAYIQKEVIPGEVTRHYILTGSYSKRGRLLPNGVYNYLASEEFADGSVVSYYPSRNGEHLKKYEKLQDGTEISYHKNGRVSSEKAKDGVLTCYNEQGNLESETFPDGTMKQYFLNGEVCYEKFPDGSWKKYDYDVQETRISSLIGMHNSSKGHRYRRSRYYLREEQCPNGERKLYYPSGKLESLTLKDGTQQTWYKSGAKKSEQTPDGAYVEFDVHGRVTHQKRPDGMVFDYKYDQNGNLIYHAVNGCEDTIKYLAMKKVAERQAEKSEKLRKQNGDTGRQTVSKLNKVEKVVKMAVATWSVKRDLGRE